VLAGVGFFDRRSRRKADGCSSPYSLGHPLRSRLVTDSVVREACAAAGKGDGSRSPFAAAVPLVPSLLALTLFVPAQ
jgi:hypothetical protein